MPNSLPLSGPEAIDALRPLLDTLQLTSTRLPLFHAARILPAVAPLSEQLTAHRDALAAVYSEAHRQRFTDAIDRLPSALRAYNYASSQLRAWREPSDLGALIDEATRLRAALFHGLELLAAFRRIPAQQVEQLKRGRGYVDLADDLQAGVPVARTHWDTLAAIQSHQSDPTLHLTPDDLARMIELGDLILERLHVHQTEDEAHWRDLTLRTGALLESTWDTLRLFAPTAWRLLGQPQLADSFKSLLAFQRG
jgi:hypothetical protein